MKISLNLLPPAKKKALQQGFIMAFAQSMALYLFIVVLFIAGTLISVRVLLNGDFNSLQQPTAGTEEYAASTGEIKQINAYLARIGSFESRFTVWSAVLKSITDAAPAGVRIETLGISPDGSVRLTGLAAARDDLLAFKSGLSSLAALKDITSPLSDLLQKKDVKFELTMRWSPAAPAVKK